MVIYFLFNDRGCLHKTNPSKTGARSQDKLPLYNSNCHLKNAKIEADPELLIAMQPNIEIYTWQSCPFCIRAKALLTGKGVEFTEYSIDGDEPARSKMSVRSNGKRSVPQIFIDDVHIGGCDDIHALDRQGKLDRLLGIA